ncbi:hypothetical protein FY136_28495 (plasmid) [Agrobacterium tumefaciens]|nr:hypothetical protein [Agrobacterium tumefaciens]UXT53203.1 hypothetical protein FY136_28495 [Agrobacterium tumefaciens]
MKEKKGADPIEELPPLLKGIIQANGLVALGQLVVARTLADALARQVRK